MKIRFLLDENLSPRIKLAILRYNKSIDILRVGDENTPPLGTSDTDILLFIEKNKRILATDNRATMPDYAYKHLSSGNHHWGMLEVRLKIQSLSLLLHCSKRDMRHNPWLTGPGMRIRAPIGIRSRQCSLIVSDTFRHREPMRRTEPAFR